MARQCSRRDSASRGQDGSATGLSPQPDIYVETYVTGYNTVPGQTDYTPCIAASGANICGRRDTVACPPFLPLGAVVEIKGKKYVCEDRIGRKYQARKPPS